ncbi:LysE family translocator [uncultured Lentibacter sp.]|uniref:LysE family translocator n=1 Tax=uncultured Lentibacter sp. TaxID=1659309 RepID=UPI0026262EDC|nr:LysE family translocator [uncultured Lentibacter sp.]
MLETLLSMDIALILAFTSAGILLNITPGTDVAFSMASGISGGPRAGVAAALGITLGGLTHMMLAVLGISAALLAIPHAYDAIRYIGAAYLFWLAVKTWRAPPELAKARGATRIFSALKRGYLTNLLNPKVALFVIAFLPQFTRPEAGPIWQQILFLGLIFNATGMIINSTYGIAAGYAGHRIIRMGGTLNKITSIVFGGLAARLIWE